MKMKWKLLNAFGVIVVWLATVWATNTITRRDAYREGYDLGHETGMKHVCTATCRNDGGKVLGKITSDHVCQCAVLDKSVKITE